MGSDTREIQSIAGLAIGDELLSGKVKEENMSFLIQEIRNLGAQIQGIHMLPDHIPLLAEQILESSNRYDYVITSGGLGPTHDDLTMEAVATAFDVSIERNETYAKTLQNVYGSDANETILKMADMPEGIEFEWGDMLDIPAARFKNIFILPGQPRLFRSKFSAIRERFRSDHVFYCEKLFLSLKESNLVDMLTRLHKQYSDVNIGSYPSTGEEQYRTMVSFEALDEEAVKQAVKEFSDQINSDQLLRKETF